MASRPVEDENFQYIIDNKIQPSKLPYLSTRQEGSQRTRLAGDKQVKLLPNKLWCFRQCLSSQQS